MESSGKQGQCLVNGSEKNLVDSQAQKLEDESVQYQNPSENADANFSNEQHMIDDHVDNSVVDVSANIIETHAASPLHTGTHLPLAKPLSVMSFEDPCGMKNNLKDTEMDDTNDSDSEEPRAAFTIELENFHKEMCLEFKPPKFYGEPLNLLKLWRAVSRLGGYDTVTSSKLWRQVGESFHPPKTCTTVSWTFRIFYEKALLEYEKHKRQIGELEPLTLLLPAPASVENDATGYNQVSGSGRMRRDAAARAMQGWHAQRLLGYGEVGDPIIKDKNFNPAPKREKNLKSIGLPKHKKTSNVEHGMKDLDGVKQLATSVVDVGPPANWVKINVRETKDCFEVYALVPGLLREEVRVQSDPAGRLVITGQPEQAENPWGITPFKKVVSLPARIDPLQTSAIVSLHGRLFVRVPLENSNL